MRRSNFLLSTPESPSAASYSLLAPDGRVTGWNAPEGTGFEGRIFRRQQKTQRAIDSMYAAFLHFLLGGLYRLAVFALDLLDQVSLAQLAADLAHPFVSMPYYAVYCRVTSVVPSRLAFLPFLLSFSN